MEWVSLLLMTVFSLAAAIYAQYRLPFLTATPNQAWVARVILLVTGVAFGLIAVKQIGATESSLIQLLIFVVAWGLVHVPAAIIVFLKQQQRKNPY